MFAKEYIKKYGKTGVGVYLALTTTSYVSIYCLIKKGVNLQPFLNLLHISSDNADNTGALIMAYAINKALSPIKVLLTATFTPRIHNLFLKYKHK